ncbi:uncharacterized protein LOC128227357 [Mya arenaria]|uniref:uncharacterized protein LOC128227357 n=1 Tax=Mya arenaria TaxID=6604 RepID=UPI0022E96798|nr:uncharacterized protein LOC128227357 [Mya arenaria]XP_052793764.1 uncharacterized protein LOC128227357 [Mya arenaria]
MNYIWLIFATHVVGDSLSFMCTEEFRYISDLNGELGYCERCSLCDDGGYIQRRNVSRRIDPTYGYLECYPCIECPEGSYRKPGPANVCLICMKTCANVNRYESQPCGGALPGHCGTCYQGYHSRTNEPEGYCEKVGRTENNDKGSDGIDAPRVALILTICLVIVCGVLCIGLKFHKRHRKNEQQHRFSYAEEYKLTSTERSVNAFESGYISELNTQQSIIQFEERGTSTDQEETEVAIEVEDKICKVIPLWKNVFSKVCISHIASVFEGMANDYVEHESQSSGKDYKMYLLFESLGVQKEVYKAEEERCLLHKISYCDYVQNVLNFWIENNRDANTEDLCKALHKAGFEDIAKDCEVLVDRYNSGLLDLDVYDDDLITAEQRNETMCKQFV